MQWREAQKADAPRYWRKESGSWLVRRFDQWQALPEDEPIMHVNYHEAEAWCRWQAAACPAKRNGNTPRAQVTMKAAIVIPGARHVSPPARLPWITHLQDRFRHWH